MHVLEDCFCELASGLYNYCRMHGTRLVISYHNIHSLVKQTIFFTNFEYFKFIPIILRDQVQQHSRGDEGIT